MDAMTAAPGYVGRSHVSDTERISGDLIPGTRSAFLVRDGTRPGIVDIDTGAVTAEFDPLPQPTSDRRAHTAVSADGSTAVVARPPPPTTGIVVDLTSRRSTCEAVRASAARTTLTSPSASSSHCRAPDTRRTSVGG